MKATVLAESSSHFIFSLDYLRYEDVYIHESGRNEKPVSWRPSILSHWNSHADIALSMAMRPTLAFMFQLCLKVCTDWARHNTDLITQEKSMLGLCVRYVSGKVIYYCSYTELHNSRVWICLGNCFLSVVLFTNSSVKGRSLPKMAEKKSDIFWPTLLLSCWTTKISEMYKLIKMINYPLAFLVIWNLPLA